MGRAKKKPEYDQNRIMEQFQNCIVEAYTSGIADGTGISLRQVSEEFGITLMKTRKILITAGIYHTENSEQINSMRKQGMNIPEIMKATGLSKSSVHSYLPYTKMIYNVDELSLYAERCRMYRKRKQAIEQLQICKGASLECVEKYLWSTIEIFSGYSFTTVKGLRFRYGVNGNEIQINRKKKSITRSSVKVALKATLEKNGNINGPKKLGVFGVSYLYPMFLRFGLIDTEELLQNRSEVNLFTRPRRFGKSLNMSMLKTFFEIGSNPALFDGLKISENKEICTKYMGQFPVISISLKSVEGLSFQAACGALKTVIGTEALRFSFLEERWYWDNHLKTSQSDRRNFHE